MNEWTNEWVDGLMDGMSEVLFFVSYLFFEFLLRYLFFGFSAFHSLAFPSLSHPLLELPLWVPDTFLRTLQAHAFHPTAADKKTQRFAHTWIKYLAK